MSILKLTKTSEIQDWLRETEDKYVLPKFVVIPTNINKPSYEVIYKDGILLQVLKIHMDKEVDITQYSEMYGLPEKIFSMPRDKYITLYGEGSTKIIFTDFSLIDEYIDSYIERLDLIKEWGLPITTFRTYYKKDLIQYIDKIQEDKKDFNNQSGIIVLYDKSRDGDQNDMIYISLK